MKKTFLRPVLAVMLIALCFITYAIPKTSAAPVDGKSKVTAVTPSDTSATPIDLTAVSTVREQEYTATGVVPTSTAEISREAVNHDQPGISEAHLTLLGRPPSW